MDLNTEVIGQTYELTDMINQSNEVMEYLQYKQVLDQDQEVIQLKKKLARAKEKYDEVKRFNQYHPDYQETKEQLDQILAAIDKNERVQRFKKAEERLDQLLYEVTTTLANAISKSIKVGHNDLNHNNVCATGGCSTCSLKENCVI